MALQTHGASATNQGLLKTAAKTWMFIKSEPANFPTLVRLASDKLLYNVNVMSHFVRLSIVDCDPCVVGDDANHVEQVLD